jgi:hypothetical protein
MRGNHCLRCVRRFGPRCDHSLHIFLTYRDYGMWGIGPGMSVADLALIPRGFPDWVLSQAGSTK